MNVVLLYTILTLCVLDIGVVLLKILSVKPLSIG